jgi:predicted alpha/beta superfamily hydrolase
MQIGKLKLIIILAAFNISVCASETISIGEKQRIVSKVLNEKRTLLIHLPESYQDSDNSYPVLYSLDGEIQFSNIVGIVDWYSVQSEQARELIIVSIENTDRNRDLTPSIPNGQDSSDFGGAAKFSKFIESEVIPFVETKYRTTSFRILVGHSMGGLFALEVLTSKPELFDASIVISPFLNFDKKEFVRRSSKSLKNRENSKHFIQISIANEPELLEGYQQLSDNLTKYAQSSSIKWQSLSYPNETHMSTFTKALHDGLKATSFYRGWDISEDMVSQDIKQVKTHYANLSGYFGEDISVPSNVIDKMVDQARTSGYAEKAIAILRQITIDNPTSIKAHKDLGIAYVQSKFLEKGLNSLNKALELAKNQSDDSTENLTKTIEYVSGMLN